MRYALFSMCYSNKGIFPQQKDDRAIKMIKPVSVGRWPLPCLINDKQAPNLRENDIVSMADIRQQPHTPCSPLVQPSWCPILAELHSVASPLPRLSLSLTHVPFLLSAYTPPFFSFFQNSNLSIYILERKIPQCHDYKSIFFVLLFLHSLSSEISFY